MRITGGLGYTMNVYRLAALITCLLNELTSANYYYYYYTPQRLVYYPVRTNCQHRCPPQNRYRWTYRPTSTHPSNTPRHHFGNIWFRLGARYEVRTKS